MPRTTVDMGQRFLRSRQKLLRASKVYDHEHQHRAPGSRASRRDVRSQARNKSLYGYTATHRKG